MSESFDDLPAIEDGLPRSVWSDLPPIIPQFFISRLEDKPQNPIIDSLRFLSVPNSRSEPKLYTSQFSSEHAPFPAHETVPQPKLTELSDVWSIVAHHKIGGHTKVLSWDNLRYSVRPQATPSPFLSEQSSHVFASARHFVQPRLHDPSTLIIHVTQYDLLKSLRSTVIGNSSALHVWDPELEMFRLVEVEVDQGQKGVLLIDGRDEIVSSSLIKRFVTIGTLLRRIEALVSRRKGTPQTGPTAYAFTHALSSILSYLRLALSRSPFLDPSAQTDPSSSSFPQTKLWFAFAEHEDILVALSRLCYCEEHIAPASYLEIPSTPPALLSHIHAHLATHTDHQSPRPVRALIAYILTTTSRNYFQHLCHTVGLGSDVKHDSTSKRTIRQLDSSSFNLSFQDEPESDGEDLDVRDDGEDELPTFIPPALADALPKAQRSLRMLREAQPDHPLLHVSSSDGNNGGDDYVRWMWTQDEIGAAWGGNYSRVPESGSSRDHNGGSATTNVEEERRRPNQDLKRYLPELAQFRIFDSEPGSQLHTAPLDSTTSHQTLSSFIDTYPDTLPSLTPSLPHLTSLVFSPLLTRTLQLSNALLAIFLVPSSLQNTANNLNIYAHLCLLRSYMLLTSHPFKSRLGAALFSDSDSYVPTSPLQRRTRDPRPSVKGKDNDEIVWAVGLAQGLAERETWPPGGADLSFFLRRVIVDSLELADDEEGRTNVRSDGNRTVWREAEFRLGFAIRDLPVGTGRDKWLDPLSIEALDFLYLDYTPPRPLRILISPDILSKYQRVFAFALRLMRVESVSHMLYRATRERSEPVFATLVPSNKLLLHFRFVAQSFVASLSSYTFDTAIGGNFDCFLERVGLARAANGETGNECSFPDVFALAESHSAVLDDILSACLLRSGQRAVQDIIQGSLETVLKLGVLVGELKRGRLEEYDAAPTLEDLWQDFRSKLKTLIGVLKLLVEKGSPSSSNTPNFRADQRDTRQPPGGSAALQQLLIRLDLGDYWTRSTKGANQGL